MFELPIIFVAALFSSGLVTLFTVLLIVGLIISTANDKFLLSYFSIVLYATVLSIFTDVNLYSYTWHNPGSVVLTLLEYIALGGIYSVFKYATWAKAIAVKIQKIKRQFIEDSQLQMLITEEIPCSFLQTWKGYLYNKLDSDTYRRVKDGISPTNQATLITHWIAFWPVFGLGSFVATPLQEFIKAVYRQLGNVYKRIYTHLISKYINVKDLDFR
jgi:hypothetical protein